MSDEQNLARGTLTMEDMSYVLDDESLMRGEARQKLQQDILGDPRYAEMFAEAETARRDGGIATLWEALSYLADLEKLLTTEGWENPADVLLPGEDDTSDLGDRVLIAIADARIARGEDRERLRAVKERLERCEGRYAEQALEKLVEEVARLSPRSAAKMIERAETAMDEVLGRS